MKNIDRNSFVIGFIRGYTESNIQRFEKNDGKYILSKVKIVNYEKIKHLAELNAIRCLMHNRVYDDENFTLGEILDILGKNNEQAQQIKDNLAKLPSWTS